MERQRKRYNIVITGLRGEWDSIKVQEWLEEKIGVKARIAETWRTGKNKSVIVARCKEESEKEKIMRNKKKLGEERVHCDTLNL